MSDLHELKTRKEKLEKELNKITLKQNNLNNERNYSDINRANEIISEIEKLSIEINNHYDLIKKNNEQYKHLGETPAVAARYEAQERLLHLSKEELKQAIVSGEKERFKHLWLKANVINEEEQEKVKDELNKMFRK